MVEVNDVTEEKQKKIDRNNLEKKLAKECFVGRKIKVSGSLMLIEGGAYKYFETTLMYVNNKDIFPQAEEFGRKYEKKFGMKGDFIIETDYS